MKLKAAMALTFLFIALSLIATTANGLAEPDSQHTVMTASPPFVSSAPAE